MKKLSIITICYNEPNLEKTCKSVVNQTWQDFEWIVIDGGSNQETLDIFEKYKYRIDKFVSEPDKGIYNACNKGIKLADGYRLNFLNAGDCYHSNEVLNKVFKQEHQGDVLYGEQYQVYKKKNKCCCSKLPKHLDYKFFINNNIHTPATFIKKELFDKYGNFNEEYKIVSDFEKWILFYRHGVQFQHLDMIVADFDMTGISSNKEYSQLHQKERQDVIESFYTKDEIVAARKKYKNFSIIEKLFSITNTYNGNHKTITILGFHIKIRRKISVQ